VIGVVIKFTTLFLFRIEKFEGARWGLKPILHPQDLHPQRRKRRTVVFDEARKS
jgi:hypothetical protein